MKTTLRTTCCALGAIIVPALIMCGTVTLQHAYNIRHPDIEICFFSVCILVGLLFIWFIPMRTFYKCLTTIAYVPAAILMFAVIQLLLDSAMYGHM